jgi:FkbM family methyltransferase
VKRPRGGVPLRAIARLCRNEWALRYRLAEQPSPVTVHGVTLSLDGDWATPKVRRMVYHGWHEASERGVLEHTLRPDDVYLEAGAGIGYVTTCACRIVGAQNVTAFEADPRLAAAAVETARLNGFAPAIINAALGRDDGETDFYVHDDFRTSTLVPTAEARPIRVPVRSFAAELARLRPTYLMVDIEGGEVELFSDPLPPHVRAVCVETHPEIVGDSVQRMLRDLMDGGFQLDLRTSGDGIAFLARPGSGGEADA